MMKFKKRYSSIINPYNFFIIAFLATLILYQLDFSNFNSEFGNELKLFLTIMFLGQLLMSVLFNYIFGRNQNTFAGYVFVGLKPINLRLISLSFFFLGILEMIYSHGSPLFGQGVYKDYGIPTLHVVIISCASFYILYLCQTLFQKSFLRKKILFNIILTLTPITLGLSRGTVVMLGISIAILFLTTVSFKFSKKYIFIIIVIATVGSYFFGLFGNYRINHDYKYTEPVNQSSLILRIGQANENFYDSKIPSPFFWTYIYITSPISNLSKTIQVDAGTENFSNSRNYEFLVINFLPDFISKRLVKNSSELIRGQRVTEEFTVSTVFCGPYVMLGWDGMLIMLMVLLFFPIIYFYFVIKFAKKFYFMALSIMSTMYILMPFSNFLTFGALSIQLLFPFILSIRVRSPKKKLI